MKKYIAKRAATMFGVLLITLLITIMLVGSNMDTILKQGVVFQVRSEITENPEIAQSFSSVQEFEGYIQDRTDERIKNLGLDEPWYSPQRIGLTMYKIILLDFGQATFLTSDLGSSDVKEIIFENNISEWVKYVCKPNYQELGPKLGKDVNKLKSELDSLNQDEIADIIEAGSFTFSNQKIDLHSLDLQLVATADRPNQDIVNDFLISLNTDIDDELLEERISREIVSLIQKLRKESDYDITDRIITTISSEDEIVLSAIKSHVKYIQNETLSVSFSTVKKPGIENLLNYSISIQIEKS